MRLYDEDSPRFTSAGRLPAASNLQRAVDEAWRRFSAHSDGAPAAVYPALAAVDPALFGLAVVATSGQTFPAGSRSDGRCC